MGARCRWPNCRGKCCLPAILSNRMRWREGDYILEADIGQGFRRMQKIQGDVKGLGWQAAYDERPFQIGPHYFRPENGGARVPAT